MIELSEKTNTDQTEIILPKSNTKSRENIITTSPNKA